MTKKGLGNTFTWSSKCPMRRGTWDSARLRPPCLLTVESRFVLHSGSLFSLYIFLCLNKNSVQQHIYIRISTSQSHTHNLVYIFSGLMGSHFHNFFFSTCYISKIFLSKSSTFRSISYFFLSSSRYFRAWREQNEITLTDGYLGCFQIL